MITDEEARKAAETIIEYCRPRMGDNDDLDDFHCKNCIFYWKDIYDKSHYCVFRCEPLPCLKGVFKKEGNNKTEVPVHTDNDAVNHPQHYCHGGIETIDILKAKMPRPWFLGFLKGNVLKYITRSEFKGSEIEDFKKAAWYLDRLITEFEKDKET